jgi:hypothetical protein
MVSGAGSDILGIGVSLRLVKEPLTIAYPRRDERQRVRMHTCFATSWVVKRGVRY